MDIPIPGSAFDFEDVALGLVCSFDFPNLQINERVLLTECGGRRFGGRTLHARKNAEPPFAFRPGNNLIMARDEAIASGLGLLLGLENCRCRRSTRALSYAARK